MSITHKIGKLWKLYWVPEVGVTIAAGVLVGYIASLRNRSEDLLSSFSPQLFFSYLLPIIIFTSGFQQSYTQFCQYYVEIILFAVLGTVISAIVIGYALYGLGQTNLVDTMSLMECLAFGAMISATDPVATLAVFSDLRVDPCLYVIVFGSSVLDDAIAVILMNTFNSFIGKSFDLLYALTTIVTYFLVNLIGSSVMGSIIGVSSVYLMKIDPSLRAKKPILLATCIATIYISYLIAYIFQLSGIISSFYASMIFKRYIPRVLSAEDVESIKEVFDIIAYIAEYVVFFSIGMSIFDPARLRAYDPAFITIVFVLCVIGRGAFVYPLSLILNRVRGPQNDRYVDDAETTSPRGSHVNQYQINTHKNQQPDASKLDLNIQHMILFAGLRGPISYGSSLLFPNTFNNRDLVITTTRAIVLLTIYIKGGLTATALKYFRIKQMTQFEEEQISMSHQSSPSTDQINETTFWGKMEKKYIAPLFSDGSESIWHVITSRRYNDGEPPLMLWHMMRRRGGRSDSYSYAPANSQSRHDNGESERDIEMTNKI